MADKERKKKNVKKPKRTSVSIWTENTGSKSANDAAWDKAVRETNKKCPNILEPKRDEK